MVQAKTYVVGNEGKVKRLDDLTLPWVDVSIPNSIDVGFILHDVETDPNNSNKVFAVGTYHVNTGFSGIYYSTNGGVTWLQPGGDYHTYMLAGHVWYEVSVVNSSVIYICGVEGWVCKSIDGGLNFNMCTQITGLYYMSGKRGPIPCHSLHFVSAISGVVGLTNNVVKTIDGGVTWDACCNGQGIENPLTPVPWPGTWMGGVHTNLLLTEIVALSERAIYRCTNGGSTNWTFTPVYAFTWDSIHSIMGYHLTWTDDLHLWGFGTKGQKVRSNDGGATWNIITTYSPTGPDHYSGHFYNGNNGFFGRDNIVNITYDGSNSFIFSDDFITDPLAIWTKWTEGTCYLLTNCEEGINSIVTSTDLSQYLGSTIELCVTEYSPEPPNPVSSLYATVRDCCQELPDMYIGTSFYLGAPVYFFPNFHNRCWRIISREYDEEQTYDAINTVGYSAHESCRECLEYNPCPPPEPTIGCNCYIVTEAANCEGAIVLNPFWEITEYEDCAECVGTCVELVDCTNFENTVIVVNDLLELDTIIQIEGQTTCWIVTEYEGSCAGATILTQNFTVFSTCQECLPPVPVIPPPPLSTRLVKPGYNTPGCPPEFTEKISCKFANAAYNIMVVERYGVKMCCDLVMYKLDIKKQILDLKALYDETLCVSSIVCSSVCPECPEDEEPEPQEWQPGTPIPGDQPN